MCSLRITILVDNYVRRRGLLAEHGWAAWIETPQCRVLFDTGQGAALLHNARELGVPLASADAVVLSHGHYDHTGRLAAVVDLAPQARVYAHPAAFDPKYAQNVDGSVREVGMPQGVAELRARLGERLVLTCEPVNVAAGLLLTGQVPREASYEDTGGRFFTDTDCRRPDTLPDDQALLLRTAAGTVLLLGCAHAGVVNTTRYARALWPAPPIHAILGGMHLAGARADRLARTTVELHTLDLGLLVPAHCTGRHPTSMLQTALPGVCTPGEVGASFSFEGLSAA